MTTTTWRSSCACIARQPTDGGINLLYYIQVASTPKIQPIHIKEYTVKQSTYDVVGKLPIRSIVLGPSGSGKTVLLQNMILDIDKGCFNRVYIFSPSIEVDASWLPVKKYIENEMGVKHTDEDPIYVDHYDPEALHDIIDTQHKITD